jgi:hypothetical protein
VRGFYLQSQKVMIAQDKNQEEKGGGLLQDMRLTKSTVRNNTQ